MNQTDPLSSRGQIATYIDRLASAIRANASSGLPEDKPGMERAAQLLDLHKTRVLEGDEHTWLAPVLGALSDAAADRAAVEGAYGLASRWAMLRTYGSAATELRNVLVKTEPRISHAERREQLAAGIYEFWNPGSRWEDAHADDVTCYRADADAAMTAADALAGRGAAARTKADIYLEVAARLDAFGTKSKPEWARYCVQAGAEVQEWAAQLGAADAGMPHPEPVADRALLRQRIASALAGTTLRPPVQHSLAMADAVLAVLPVPADQAAAIRRAALREAADRYTKLADQNEAYDREHGDLDEAARLTHGAVRDVAAGLRRMAAEMPQPDQPGTATDLAGETQQDARGPVKESTRRYAEELRNNPGAASADGHTGWECNAGASLIVEASTPGPGKLGTHHGVIYACARHREASVERITGAGYEVDPQPAPPGHRHSPWPCGHVTAYDTKALAALTGTAPAAEA
ncbi:hypothetical protein [Streptomyces tauricus]